MDSIKTTPPNLSEIIDRMDDLFLFLMNFTKNQILEESIKNELTCSQFSVLYHLSHCARMTMNELTHILSLTHGASTGLIDRLLKMNLVQRERSEDDRRVVYVSITEKGLDMIRNIRIKRHHILHDLLTSLPEDDHQTLIAVLSNIKNRIEKIQ